MSPFAALMSLYYLSIDPLLVRLRKRTRLRSWLHRDELPVKRLAMHETAAHGPDGTLALRRFTRVARRYD
ncbi:hypothetical protein, partial [Bordetella petrii]|uniref:hypothetical protein n=1 Tax=Bordetella petrii TaxID=94624 RepID=UPI001E57DAAF